jgi:hypothetical protein
MSCSDVLMFDTQTLSFPSLAFCSFPFSFPTLFIVFLKFKYYMDNAPILSCIRYYENTESVHVSSASFRGKAVFRTSYRNICMCLFKYTLWFSFWCVY